MGNKSKAKPIHYTIIYTHCEASQPQFYKPDENVQGDFIDFFAGIFARVLTTDRHIHIIAIQSKSNSKSKIERKSERERAFHAAQK